MHQKYAYELKEVFDIEPASRIIEYRRNNSAGFASITISVYVLGWVE